MHTGNWGHGIPQAAPIVCYTVIRETQLRCTYVRVGHLLHTGVDYVEDGGGAAQNHAGAQR